MDNQAHNTMSKAEAIGILLRLAMRPGTTLDEITAIRLAVRTVTKRALDYAANRARKYAKAAVYTTPPAALDVVAGARPLDAILQNPPFASAQESEEDSE